MSLTWYPGTILPHASLWHTLLRATWLNDLKPGEIRDLVKGKRRRHYLHREDQSLQQVAVALGEPSRAFSRFAVRSRFPSWLSQAHVVERLRWCPACLDAGFHTLLSSIRLVGQCPIHSVPLVDACPGCGGGFGTRISGLAVRPGSCRCGRTRLLDPQVARQPRLLAKDVEPWAPVARWVRQVESVRCSVSPNGGPSLQVHLALTPRWCRDLGIDYPLCFEAGPVLWTGADEPGRWSTYTARSGDLGGESPRVLEGGVPPPQSCVYRAMGRHLRRRGLHDPDRWIVELKDTGDPVTFAMTMAARPKARAAFTEMLWSRLLEPRAHLRRWPNRPAPRDGTLSHGTPIDLEPRLGPLRIDGASVSPRAERWLEYHAMAMEARLAWDSALRRTQRCIDDRWADWSRGEEALAGRIVWYSRPKGTGLQFVGYIRDVGTRPFGSSLPTKRQRWEYQANRGEGACRPVPPAPLSPSSAQLARDAVYVHGLVKGSDRFWRVNSAGMANARWSFGRAAERRVG